MFVRHCPPPGATAWRPCGQSGIASIVVFLLLPTTAFASVVISELLWAGSDLSTADEWIELANTGTGAVSLEGWTLTKLSDGGEVDMLTLPSGAMIGPGQTFLIGNYAEAESRLGIEPDVVDTAVALSNTQLLIRLYRPEDTGRAPADAVDDGTGAPFAGLNDPPKASMERIDLAGSGQLKENWATATTFVNFDDGAPLFGTPGAPNGTGASVDIFPPQEATELSAELQMGTGTGAGTGTEATLQVSWVPSVSLDLALQTLSFNDSTLTFGATATGTTIAGVGTGVTFTLRSTDVSGNTSSGVSTVSTLFPNVRITEVLANPAGQDDGEWIEVGNLGPDFVDIGGWILDEGNSPADYILPDETVLEPGQHVALGKDTTGLPLENSGEQLSLMRGLTVMDSWTYPETAEEVSYGLRDDASGVLQPFCVPTPGKPNLVVPPDPRIVIQSVGDGTEVQPDGSLAGVNKVTVNLVAEVLTGSTVHVRCAWDFGDGYMNDSCNPPSHTFKTAGAYPIRLTYTDFCGNIVERETTATVGAQGHRQSDGSCPNIDVSGVSISEFIPDPAGKDDAPFAPPREGTGGIIAGQGEWIELLNASKKNAPLCGFVLDDGEDGSKPFALDAKEIPPFGFLVLTREETKIALNNDEDTVRLFGRKGEIVEEVTYGNSGLQPGDRAEGAAEGESYAKTASGTFAWTSTPTPGTENAFFNGETNDERRGAPLGRPPEKTATGSLAQEQREPQTYDLIVTFSEIMSNPPKEGPLRDLGEYIELINLTGTGISLAGWTLDDAPGASSKPSTFPKDYSILVYCNLCLLCNGLGCDLPLKISLNNEGEELSLTSPDGNVKSTVTYPNMDRGEAYALYADEWNRTLAPTPGERNVIRNAHVARRGATAWRPVVNIVSTNVPGAIASAGRHAVAPRRTLRTRFRHIHPVPAPAPVPVPVPVPPPLLAALLPQITDLTLPPSLATAGSPAETTKKAVFVLLALLSLSMTVFTRQKVARPL